MNNINTFYSKILNIRNSNEGENIKRIVSEEKELLKGKTSSLEGFCIYLANQIEQRLKQKGLTTYKWI